MMPATSVPRSPPFVVPFARGSRLAPGSLGLALAVVAMAVMLVALAPRTLTGHMLQQVALMSIAAPALAWAGCHYWPAASARLRLAGVTMAVQAAVLWLWHAPAAMAAVQAVPGLGLVMWASLLFAAVGYWVSILSVPADGRWRSILSLLVTAKLFCLLGILLVLAPHPLYVAACYGGAAGVADALADQQSAGLVMIVACPLFYVGVGVVMTATWLDALARKAEAAAPPRRAE